MSAIREFKIYGANKKKKIMGFKFHYPYSGCVFDITRQRYVYIKECEGLSDEDFIRDFVGIYSVVNSSLNWQDVGTFLKFKNSSRPMANA